MVFSFALPKNPSKPVAPQRSSSSSSVLQEALRLNPFAAETNNKNLVRAAPTEEAERDGLNDDLTIVSGLFPDIQFDVLRELLVKFDGDSRLQICVEQLLRHRTKWVKGRWHAPPRDIEDGVPLHASFRSIDYRSATLRLLSQEFRYLSKSTIKAVLAENNFSYTRARPTLSDLSKRTWRAAIGNLNIFQKRRENDGTPIQLLAKSKGTDGGLDTGSIELDEELLELFIQPAERKEKQYQEEQDHKLAEELNEEEARKVEALYDCECCCSEATFEKMSSCSTGAHMVCFDCIRRTIYEALFGQGWRRSIDPDRGALRCIAPLVNDPCVGCIPLPVIRQAVLMERSGIGTLVKFEDRLTEDSLLKSQLKLIRCPFCFYAEADSSHGSNDTHIPGWRLNPTRSITAFLVLAILVGFLPAILLLGTLLSALRLIDPLHKFRTSLDKLSLRNRSSRFKCRNPTCQRASCLKCQKAWHNPHTCHEPLLISLRTTVEAAQTTAIKRTCPRCGLSFVKASGCNKLTCVCGYSMCYLCRKALGAPSLLEYPRAGRPAEDMEGYRHFCEHFRINPGRSCTECRKCDLYRSEDEDAIVKRAGETAEMEWRVREGMVGVEGLGEVPGNRKRGLRTALSGDWTLQGVIDWTVGQLVEVEP